MPFFSFKKKNIVTLDIGSNTIKLADFSIQKKKPVLENFAHFAIPEDHMTIEGIVESDALQESFSQFIKKNTSDAFRLCLAITGRAVIVKKIEIATVDKQMQDELVESEARHILPFNMEDINYTYEPMDFLPTEQKERQNILLIAAKKKVVNNYNRLVSSAGYECDRVDMGGFAIADCISMAHPHIKEKGKNVLVLDIGKIGTHFIVLHGGHLIFCHFVVMGSSSYNDYLMKDMNLDYQSAESLKQGVCSGEEVPEEVLSIMRSNNTVLCDEMIVGNEYFKNQFPGMKLSECYITGGGCQAPDLTKDLEERFKVPVNILDPLQFIKCNTVMEDVKVHIKNFSAISVGLCLRGIQ